MTGLAYYGRVFYLVFGRLVRENPFAFLTGPVGFIPVLGAGRVLLFGLLKRMTGLADGNTGGLIRRIAAPAMIRFAAVIGAVGL